MSESIERNVGVLAGIEARQEYLAIKMMKSIMKSGFLQRELPGYIVPDFEAILGDEIEHLRMFTKLAKKYGVEPTRLLDYQDMQTVLDYPPWVMLRHIYTVEKMSKYGFKLNIEIHEKVTGDVDAAEMYKRISHDESWHVSVGREIHHILNQKKKYKEDFHKLQKLHIVENAYRQTFGDRSYIRRKFGLEEEVTHVAIPKGISDDIA